MNGGHHATINLSKVPRDKLLRVHQDTKPKSGLYHAEQGNAKWDWKTLNYVWLQAYPVAAVCIQKFDDSRGFAIRITYRILLRSSSV